MTARILLAFLLGLTACLAGCAAGPGEEFGRGERQRAAGSGVRLSKAEREGIGLKVVQAGRRKVRSALDTAGWLMVRPGSEVVVKAPATGFLAETTSERVPVLGEAVRPGDPLAMLRVFVSPQEEAQLVALKEEADTVIRQSQAALEAARARYDRICELGTRGSVPQREIELAKERLEQAKAAYEEAQQKLPFLPAEPYSRPLKLSSVPIVSPLAGRITAVHVRPGQLVVQGDPLWTVSDWSRLWLRVPVFEGDLGKLAAGEPAEVRVVGSGVVLAARPTGIPQPTAPGRRTVDLLYEVDNPRLDLRPGQAVLVSLPTGQSADRLVVPRGAIVYDGSGNAWVYVEAAPGFFCRRRVRLGPRAGQDVVIEQGLAEGDRVVAVGAEALYGQEFKSQIPTEEEEEDE